MQVSGEDRVRIKMSPVRVLNLLGESGYRVIGASSAGGGRDTGAYAWTMEKKSFAAATADSNGAVGNGGQGGGRRQDYQSRYDFDEADRYGSRGRGY